VDVGELFPLLAGVLAAAVAMRFATLRARAACVAAISVGFGVTATVINGEEWFLVPVDTAIVAVCSVAILAAPRLWARARGGAPAGAEREAGSRG
jgi:hypothetical protein